MACVLCPLPFRDGLSPNLVLAALFGSGLYGSVGRSEGEAVINAHRLIRYSNKKGAIICDFSVPIFLDVIIAQTHLGESTRREESLKKTIEAQVERIRVNSDGQDAKAELQELEDETKGLRRRTWHQLQELDRAEYSFPDDLDKVMTP